MEFRFDASQEYQLSAIEAACGLLEGQPRVLSTLVIPPGASFSAIANRLDLTSDDLLRNLHDVQEKAGVDMMLGIGGDRAVPEPGGLERCACPRSSCDTGPSGSHAAAAGHRAC